MTLERLIVRMGYAALVGALIGCGLHAPPMLALAAVSAWAWWDAYRRGDA